MNTLKNWRPVFTVKELTYIIKEFLEREEIFVGVGVVGEISNLRLTSAGHIYFTLKDNEAQIQCVYFKGFQETEISELKNGTSVIVTGKLTVYPPKGIYQIQVWEIELAGVGELYKKLEKLKEKLQKEGLFAPERKRPLPKFPGRVAIITSPAGAAVKDIIKTITERVPIIEIIVIPAIVQGEEAPASLIKALTQSRSLSPLPDVIIIGRGGGSIEELWAFNNEEVVRAIFASPVPVITAIGHEVDYTLADFVGDFRAPTPTAAAMTVVSAVQDLISQANQLKASLIETLNLKILNYKEHLLKLKKLSPLSYPYTLFTLPQQKLDYTIEELKHLIFEKIKWQEMKLKHLHSNLNALSPVSILERGYAICTELKTNKLISSRQEVKPGDKIKITVKDGDFKAEVKEAEEF